MGREGGGGELDRRVVRGEGGGGLKGARGKGQ